MASRSIRLRSSTRCALSPFRNWCVPRSSRPTVSSTSPSTSAGSPRPEPRRTSTRSPHSIATSSAGRSCSSRSPPTCTSPTRRSGSSIGMRTSRSRSALPRSFPATPSADSQVTVTPAEVAEYYKNHTDAFERPKTAFVSYIVAAELPGCVRLCRCPGPCPAGPGGGRRWRAVRRGGPAGIRPTAFLPRTAATWASGRRATWTRPSTPPRSPFRRMPCRSRCSRSSAITSSR